MWIVTVFDQQSVRLYEYSTRQEAEKALPHFPGTKIVTQVV